MFFVISFPLFTWTFYDIYESFVKFIILPTPGRLDLEVNLDEAESVELPPTPAPRSVKTTRVRRRPKVKEESSSDGEVSPTSVVPPSSSNTRTHSQRASKTAAMTKMTANNILSIDEEDEAEDDDNQEDSGSEVTSEHDSDAF